LTALAAHVLSRFAADEAAAPLVRELYVWLVGTSLLFVTLPFLWMAYGPVRDAGPLTGRSFGFHMLDPNAPENAPLLPWL